MAGMLPGVEMHRRRKAKTQRFHEDNISFYGNHASAHRSRIEPSTMADTTTTMDEAALIARRRLEERLGYSRPSRMNGVEANEGSRGNQITRSTRDGDDQQQHLVSKILGRPWHFQLISSSSKSKRGQLICVVCLENFRAEDQQAMELPCSHKYHSKCLLPWLSSHPNCPTCRIPVHV